MCAGVRVTESSSRMYSDVFIKGGPSCSCPTGRTPSGGWQGGRDAASEHIENDSVKNKRMYNMMNKMQRTLLNEYIGT
jgi:hypothetical protein